MILWNGWEKERCSKCGRLHKMDNCTIKMPCNICKEIHLTIFHNVNAKKSATVMLTSSPSGLLYMDKPNHSHKVMLRVVNECLHNWERTLATYAILDDGADRSILLPQAVQCLDLTTQPETILLKKWDKIQCNWMEHLYPLKFPLPTIQLKGTLSMEHSLQRTLDCQSTHIPWSSYKSSITISEVFHYSLLMIGSDFAHLISATEPILMGPPGGPLAVHTRLRWALQGPASIIQTQHTLSFTLTCFKSECSGMCKDSGRLTPCPIWMKRQPQDQNKTS